jgi:small subunit ribosomal protein S17e
MGRVKSIMVKTLSRDLLEQHREKFGPNFDSNKKVLKEVKEIKSKRVRNVTAGYITKEMKRSKKKA